VAEDLSNQDAAAATAKFQELIDLVIALLAEVKLATFEAAGAAREGAACEAAAPGSAAATKLKELIGLVDNLPAQVKLAACEAAGAAGETPAAAARKSAAAATEAKLQELVAHVDDLPVEIKREMDRVWDALANCQWHTRQSLHVLGIPVLTQESVGITVSDFTGNQPGCFLCWW
jgi:hypothetical protein